ncbi:MAG TPA: sigma-70 family RNA polymerase sigma factor [Thermoleophilaceae bacterium]|nr:sigma-70 family RNA polymerase sigma factor [Thermoleophilaceae bacterium]
MIATAGCEAADAELVAAVRAGDDSAFEELYRRYQPRIARFVCGMLHDAARCEDVAQEAFLSALRRMRETDCEINFKPWIYQIARNAAIDSYRRNSHAVEVSMDADDGLRASDRTRLVGLEGSPDAALITKERLDHLQGAFDELSDVHTRVLVMRELEGMSYREIGERLELTRPAVESALFRARRRLESEYSELSEGRRCEAMEGTIARIAQGTQRGTEEQRLARHARRCHSCRRRARELGIEPLSALGALRQKAAALLPLPWLLRRSGGDGGGITGFFGAGANAAPLAERAAALVAVAALAGAGGAALGTGALPGEREAGKQDRVAIERSAAGTQERQRGATGAATDGERKGTRQASGQRDSGQAGGRAGGSTGTDGAQAGSQDAPATSQSGPATGDSAPSLDGSAPNLPAVPGTGDGSSSPELKLETSVPELPPVEIQAPTQSLPQVDVPTVELPSTDDVTDALPTLP